jgi:hypothetical protein
MKELHGLWDRDSFVERVKSLRGGASLNETRQDEGGESGKEGSDA